MQRPATAATSDNAAAFLQKATREEVLLTSLCLDRNRVRLSTGFPGNRALHCLKGISILQTKASDANEIDYATEFVRHEIAYETGAIEWGASSGKWTGTKRGSLGPNFFAEFG